MERSDIVNEVIHFVRNNYLLDDESNLGEEDNIIAAGIVDSTGILELITFVEQKYGFQFKDEELTSDNFQSISRIADFVLIKRSSGKD